MAILVYTVAILVNAAEPNKQRDGVMSFISYFYSSSHLKRMVAWFLRLKSLLLELSKKKKQLKESFDSSSAEEALEEEL